MKRLENLFLKSCAYTVMIVLLFFVFTAATDFTVAAITFKTFLPILLFGVLIAVASLVFEVKAIHKVLQILTHYVVLLIAFIVIFLVAGNIVSAGGGAIFSAVAIFTFLYAVFFLLAFLVIKLIKLSDKNLDKKAPKKVEKKSEYKPLYGKKN